MPGRGAYSQSYAKTGANLYQGYFVLNHASLAGQQTLFAQLWKEYSLSDSRYLTSDPFMVSVETITVVSPATTLSQHPMKYEG